MDCMTIGNRLVTARFAIGVHVLGSHQGDGTLLGGLLRGYYGTVYKRKHIRLDTLHEALLVVLCEFLALAGAGSGHSVKCYVQLQCNSIKCYVQKSM